MSDSHNIVSDANHVSTPREACSIKGDLLMNVTVTGLALVCVLCPSPANAGVPTSTMIAIAALQDAEQSNDAPDLDPQAVAELQKMIAELARHDRLLFETYTTRDVVQDSGMKLQFDTEQKIGIHRPDKLYSIAQRDDGRSTKFVFRGSTLSYVNMADNEYVQLSVPATINKMLDYVLEDLDLPAPPMLDFLYSDMEASFLSGLQSAWYVGESTIRGTKCHHLALSHEDVDFQIWIPTAGPALPAKYAITWKNEPHTPGFTARFVKWNTDPSFAKDAFSFVKPNGATKIDLPQPTTERD